MNRVLLYGGTAEGRLLACRLSEAGKEVCVSVASSAGANALPKDDPRINVLVGSLSLSEKIELMSGFDAVVDATHPYAVGISEHVREAARQSGVPYLRVIRPQSDVDGCTVVPSMEAAIAAIPSQGNVLSTVGSKEIGAFVALPDFQRRVFARVLDAESSVDACLQAGLDSSHILAKRGPFSVEENLQDIDACRIEVLVTKDGGEAGGYPQKLQAARERGIQMIVIDRPTKEVGMTVEQAFQTVCGEGARA